MNAISSIQAALPRAPFDAARDAAATWRGRCLGAFTRSEAAVTETLLALAAVEGRGALLKLPHLVGQRYDALAGAIGPSGAFAKEGKGAVGALTRFRRHDALRTFVEQFGADNAPLKDQKVALVAKLAVVDGPASAISFHPAAVASFKTALADLNAELCEDGERPSAKLIRSVVDRVIVTPAEQKPRSPFERRSMKVEIIGGLDALLSGTAVDRFTTRSVREGGGSGGGT